MTTATIHKIGADFLASVESVITSRRGADAWATAVAEVRNPAFVSGYSCPFHDHCDANEVMAEAMEANGVSTEDLCSDDATLAIWDQAWSHAHALVRAAA
jgi:hypothetical protein